MIVRSAYLEGSVAEGDREAFDRQMSQTVMPAIATYPGIRDARLRRIRAADEGSPPVYMVFELYFDSMQDMDAALQSPIRQQVRGTLVEAMRLFKGRVYHLVFEQ
jgi:uncharacterized protein (TIGR02118 family)